MRKKIGLVAWSFGSAPLVDEPCACNQNLAHAVALIVAEERDSEVVPVVQLEIGRKGIPGVTITKVVGLPPEGRANDSSWVMEEAAKVFREQGVTEVIPVANQFMHLWACKKLVRDAGFTPLHRKYPPIGFYPKSLTWWTRGPLRLIVYAIAQKLTGYRGDWRPS